MTYLLTEAARGKCKDQAPAKVSAGQSRVTVDGSPVLTTESKMSIQGCPHMVGTVHEPCTKIRVLESAEKVRVMGKPVLLAGCKTLNEPLLLAGTDFEERQTRVKGR